MKISKKELVTLEACLPFFMVGELKDICEKFRLPTTGQKGNLIARILHFLATGTLKAEPQMPAYSRAPRGQRQPLTPHSLILFGDYKNDLVTRMFMKTLVGNHFHFTAFGQDWMKERWFEGNPPTYGEFAQFWQNEYTKRKKSEGSPKKEWALLTFVLAFKKKNPGVSREIVCAAWYEERLRQVSMGMKILQHLL